MSDVATQRLARVREAYIRDEQGRETAGKKVVEQVLAAARKVGLDVQTQGEIHRIRLGGTFNGVTVDLSTGAGIVYVDVQPVDEWKYDPIRKEFEGPNGEDAVDMLAEKIGLLLEEKADKLTGKRRELSILG